jgi:polysaccharide biosynthesis transport protein
MPLISTGGESSAKLVPAGSAEQDYLSVSPGFRSSSPAAELLEILTRRRTLFLAVVVILSVLGIGLVFNIKSTYTADAMVLFDPRTRQVLNSEPVLGRFSVDSRTLESEVETELQRIISRRVLDPVIAKFHLVADPEFNRSGFEKLIETFSQWTILPIAWREAAVGILRTGLSGDAASELDAARQTTIRSVSRRLTAQVQGHSTAMKISFVSEDPKKAAAIVNAIAAEYVQLSVEDRSAAVDEALRVLNERSSELRQQVLVAETAVEEYRSKEHLVEGDGHSITSNQINLTNTQLIQAQADLAAVQSRLHQTEAVASNPDAAPEVLASPVIQGLRQEEIRQAAQLAEARNRSGDAYAPVVSRQITLSALRNKINAEIGNIINGQRAAVVGAEARVKLLAATLSAFIREAERQAGAEVHLRQLKSEATVKHSLYETFLGRIQEVSQQVGTAQPYAQVITPAEKPEQPSWPNIRLLVPSILLIATAIASCSVVCAEHFGRTFKSLSQVADLFGEWPTALIPRYSRRHNWLFRWFGKGRAEPMPKNGPYAESINALRVQLRSVGGTKQTILFASAIEFEGKTNTAIAFARQEAQAGRKIVMIDADLRRPKLHLHFGGSRAGLAELLGDAGGSLECAIQIDPVTGLAYLAAGGPVASPIDLLSSSRMQALLMELHRNYDRIVIDAPAVLGVADARLLTGLATWTVYLVKWAFTPRRLALLGLTMLRRSGATLFGPVFVGVDHRTFALGGASHVRSYLTMKGPGEHIR